MNRRIRNILVAALALAGLATPAVVFASNAPTLNQTVNAGTLSTDIYQSDDTTPVASPSVSFPAINRSFSCQTNTATLGDTNNKVGVTNFANNNGWDLAIAATSGPTATWTSGSDHYKFNDAAGSGCTNGQMTVDPSVAPITTDCSSVCNGVTVNNGASTAFVSGSADSVTLMTTSNGTAWKGYLTGVGLSQKIPASQVSGSYSLGMTITVTAH
jgi:hypothetical protein